MSLPELLAPAGSPEGVRAAVQSGATAVYMGFGSFNARRGAKNFTPDEMADAIAYCRARGVKTNLTLNTLVGGRELDAALADARFLYEAGADALIVQDLGLARRLRQCAPSLALHASTQMTIATLDGARQAKALGFSRVVLSRETPMSEIRRITKESGVETEIFVHGALCRCYSGQCWLSAVIGQRSGNRGLCAQPCRLPYRYDGAGRERYPLSLKDLSLAHHIPELCGAGIASLKIEGRMKRPEYTAVVTSVYAALLREQRRPTPEEEDALRRVFSRDGFTDGYFTGKPSPAMLGTKTELPLHEVQPLYDEAARRFAEGREAPLVPVRLSLTADETGLLLNAWDGETDGVTVTDLVPVDPARTRPTTPGQAEKSLRKTGGTPFAVTAVSVTLCDGLMVPAARLNALRREALERLLRQREAPPVREPWTAVPPEPSGAVPCPDKGIILEARTFAQAETALRAGTPAALYLPLTELAGDPGRTQALAGKLPLAAVLPRVFFDCDRRHILDMLQAVQAAGVRTALAGNLGHIPLLREQGMEVYGDFGLNAYNKDTLHALAGMGVTRQTLSFELRLEQAGALHGGIETELLAYGYLPLMVFELCAIRQKAGACTCKDGITRLTDRTSHSFPLLPEYGCRNTLLNSMPLSLAQKEVPAVDYARLRFTIETPAECERVFREFLSGERPTCADGTTRGLYRRGVQ
ncbi:U32 family peptidase [Clostridiaceae bacterium]|nr:U32 family peptidase [Clostridiaceae bacterium]